jgi:hypothetical protein
MAVEKWRPGSKGVRVINSQHVSYHDRCAEEQMCSFRS